MSASPVSFAVFTKPWKQPLPELAAQVAGWGFDGIELPVRPGYQVTPEHVERDLPQAVQALAGAGLKIFSVAAPGGPVAEALLAACAGSGVPVVRIMAGIEAGGYMATEAHMQREFERLLPLLQKYGVKLGVQNHSGRMVCDAMGLLHLVEKCDPQYIGAIWDAAHNALQGEEPELALEIIWSHLLMVNLKNAFWQRTNGPEAEAAEWRPYWTTGPQGLASWPRVAAELKRRAYTGVVCLTAEYSDEANVERYIARDIAYARRVFGQEA